MGAAPPVAPAVNAMLNVWLEGAIEVITGAPGVVAGVATTAALASPEPRAFTARTRTVYCCALVKPVIENTPVVFTGDKVTQVEPLFTEY